MYFRASDPSTGQRDKLLSCHNLCKLLYYHLWAGRNGEKVPNRTFLGSHNVLQITNSQTRVINFRSIRISSTFIKNNGDLGGKKVSRYRYYLYRCQYRFRYQYRYTFTVELAKKFFFSMQSAIGSMKKKN